MKTAEQIVKETAEFYNLGNRAEVNHVCAYLHWHSGNKCAVGRCMTASAIREYGDHHGAVDDLPVGDIDTLLKPSYRGHPLNFWLDLQGFHDEAMNFTHEGLSPDGAQVRDDILCKWATK